MVYALAFLSYKNYASLSYLEIIKQKFKKCIYRKIPKISPSMYKPPPPPNFALKYKVKQSKNIKFPFNYKASPIDFDTLISLHR